MARGPRAVGPGCSPCKGTHNLLRQATIALRSRHPAHPFHPMGQPSTSASPAKIMVRPGCPGAGCPGCAALAAGSSILPASRNTNGTNGGIAHPHPHPPSPRPRSPGAMTQIRPLPRLACPHVPAPSPGIRTAVMWCPAHSLLSARSPQYLGGCPSMSCPVAPQPNSCHGDQALVPSEYSGDDVESMCLGGRCLCPVPVPVPVPGRAGPPPVSPSYPSASSRPSPRFLDLRLKCG